MKNCITKTTVAFLLIAASAFGQDLRIPNTPAFSILGYEPTSVMRPTSAKKLSSDLMSSFDENGKLLLNLGMEVTPYWLKNRPYLTREEYLNPGTLQTILQTFTLSAATVRDSVTNKDNLGVGYRFEIFKASLNSEMKNVEKKMLDIESTINAVNATKAKQMMVPFTDADAAITFLTGLLTKSNVEASRVQEVTKTAKGLLAYPKVAKDIIKLCDELLVLYGGESAAFVEKVREMESKRTGFSLETAGAMKFITSSHSGNSLKKIGFWVNANYYITEKDAWTITARLMSNTTDTTAVNTDVGISYIRQEKDFNVSLEAMMRWYRAEIPDVNLLNEPITRLKKEFTYRVAAQISYTVAKDISINLSIGKEFDAPFITGTSLFSIMGINYSIFNKRYIP